MTDKSIAKRLKESLNAYSAKQRAMEAMVEHEPTRFLVAGSHLTANSAVGATSVCVSTFPKWCSVSGSNIYIVIDPGTTDCEIRKVTSVSEEVVGFSLSLDYAHAEGDSIIFTDGARIDVKWFGAKGDNSADDTIPLQRAALQASVLGRGTIVFPSGIYRTSGTITLSSNVALVGDADMVSTIYMTSNNAAVTASSASNIYISGIQFVVQSGSAITFSLVVGVIIRGCQAWCSPGTGSNYGIYFDRCDNSQIINCIFYNCYDHVYFDDCENFIIKDNSFFLGRHIDVYLLDSSFGTVSGNFFHYPDSTSVEVRGGLYITVIGNVSVVAGWNGYYAYTQYAAGVVFVGNTANACTNYGFEIAGQNNNDGNAFVVSGNVTNTNSKGVVISKTTGVLTGGNAIGESRPNDYVDGTPQTSVGCTDLRRTYMFTQALKAEDFVQSYVSGAATSSLTKIGTYPNDCFGWVVPGAVYSTFRIAWTVWWAVPANFYGTNNNVNLTMYYSIEGDTGIYYVCSSITNLYDSEQANKTATAFSDNSAYRYGSGKLVIQNIQDTTLIPSDRGLRIRIGFYFVYTVYESLTLNFFGARIKVS